MSTTPLNEASILDTLRQVVDPEIGCNIVDLGLIYGVAIEGSTIAIQMTLTTPGCPMHESLSWGVKAVLLNLEGVQDVKVDIVWDPPWQPSMMTEEARAQIGYA